jgi:hypothetical protein
MDLGGAKLSALLGDLLDSDISDNDINNSSDSSDENSDIALGIS